MANKQIFKKTTTANKSAETEKQQNQLFINLGLPVEINGEQHFINLPLSLTADNLDKAIESVKGRISKNTPTDMIEIFEGKVAIAEAVQALFEQMEEGQAVSANEIDPENDEFGFLANLEVQFFKAEPKVEVDTGNAKADIRKKLFKR